MAAWAAGAARWLLNEPRRAGSQPGAERDTNSDEPIRRQPSKYAHNLYYLALEYDTPEWYRSMTVVV